MLINELKIEFMEGLREEYPPQEVSSFFNLLAESYLGMTRLEIALSPDRPVSPEEVSRFRSAREKLSDHEPIQYIIGETEFFGLKFKVDPHVLVPRPETEELVEWVLAEARKHEQENLKILDIGTGSGCIAISLANNLPKSRVTAMDISTGAIGMAQENARRHKTRIEFLRADILDTGELKDQYDIIVSNPPYVRELERAEMDRNVLDHEPSGALFVKDEDPLLFYHKITKLASRSLPEGGKLFFEINQYLGEATGELVRAEDFSTELRKDIHGNDRMLMAVRNHKH